MARQHRAPQQTAERTRTRFPSSAAVSRPRRTWESTESYVDAHAVGGTPGVRWSIGICDDAREGLTLGIRAKR
jgi:hypothetical protein